MSNSTPSPTALPPPPQIHYTEWFIPVMLTLLGFVVTITFTIILLLCLKNRRSRKQLALDQIARAIKHENERREAEHVSEFNDTDTEVSVDNNDVTASAEERKEEDSITTSSSSAETQKPEKEEDKVNFVYDFSAMAQDLLDRNKAATATC